jgi:hypothetical protein
MGPQALAFLDQIAESIPCHLPPGKGATKIDLPVADAYHFPVSPPGTAFNINLLTDLQRVWLKNQKSRYGSLPKGVFRSDILSHESLLLSI